MAWSGELFVRSRECYFGVYFTSCEARSEIYTKITFEWAHKRFVMTVHTLFYFLHDHMRIYGQIEWVISVFRYRVTLAMSAFCLWRHNGLRDALLDWAIVTQSHEERYQTSWISFIFTVLFMAPRVRKWNIHKIQLYTHNKHVLLFYMTLEQPFLLLECHFLVCLKEIHSFFKLIGELVYFR